MLKLVEIIPIWSLICFGIGLVLCICFVPLARILGFKLGIIDLPNYRKIHNEPTPCSGGVAIYSAFFITFFGIYTYLSEHVSSYPLLDWNKITGLVVCSTILVLLGIYDDRKSLSPMTKLIIQTIVAVIAFLSGLKVEITSIPLPDNLLWLNIPITLLWFLGFINAINLIDGLDGLACGIVFIISFTLFVLGLFLHDNALSMLSGCLSGVTLAFLHFNFRQEKIFLGDNGSMLLGFLIATIPVLGVDNWKSATVSTFIVTFLCAGVPIYDTSYAIIRRIKKRTSIFTPDQEHIHHRLLAQGFTPQQVVVVLYTITIVLGVIAIGTTLMRNLLVGIAIIILGILLYVLARLHVLHIFWGIHHRLRGMEE
jgi:UDP-GlcNAc:undecaprenyl-phosphate GlcNAc-1-phosphate transferase